MNLNSLIPGNLLPHNSPMLLIDKIIDSDYISYVTTTRTVNKDDFYFNGHFPGHPIVPGVFIIEMMFQTCGILIRIIKGDSNNNISESPRIGKAVKIKSAVFKKEVGPNSVIKIISTKKFDMMSFSEFKVVAYVENEEVCEAELIISI